MASERIGDNVLLAISVSRSSRGHDALGIWRRASREAPDIPDAFP